MQSEAKSRCIYLDNHATTPMDERVFLKMKPFFCEHFGNPQSRQHPYGWQAHQAIDEARITIAQAINAHPSEIIFSSGASESSNMAIKGLFLPQAKVKNNLVITSAIEHSATLTCLKALNVIGINYIKLAPTSDGIISVESVAAELAKKPALISLFFVNNEIGTINNIAAIGALAREHGVLFHCDATQALGRLPIDCQKLNVDFMSFSAHKIYGPKGIGALYVRKDVQPLLQPLIDGGAQEWCKRAGTLNVPGIVGFAEAVRLAVSGLEEEASRIKHLRDRLWATLASLDGVRLNGTMSERVFGNLNLSFAGIDGEELILALCQDVALSTGSACSADKSGSYVLAALGLSPELRQASLRFGIGRQNTQSEIDRAALLISEEVERQRRKKKNKRLIYINRSN
jgi:cysteine desulfurase